MKLRLRFCLLFAAMAILFALCAPAWAAQVAPEVGTASLSNSWQMTWPAGVLMLVLLFGAFFAMTKYEVPLPLAMSLVSLAFLVILWEGAPAILREGFEHYSAIRSEEHT